MQTPRTGTSGRLRIPTMVDVCSLGQSSASRSRIFATSSLGAVYILRRPFITRSCRLQRKTLEMSRKTFVCFVALTSCLLTASLFAQSPAVLTIHTDQPVAKVSPTLYGLMTEEINYSYDGGLYAEMVSNRIFRGDNRSRLRNWILVENGAAQAKMSYDPKTGPSEALPFSLRLDVSQADAGSSAGVLNEGYWGMAARSNTAYTGSLYAKEDSAAVGPITISLVQNQSGKVLAITTVSGITTDWKQYPFTLKTGAVEASAANHLVITVAHPGTIWLSLVSLFPPTYRDRVNGNRIDLMEKQAAMHPAFLRFPGGNYLEGDHIPERYEWKKTIGPLVDRPTHPSPWRYHSSDGLGLLEFLEWCEDLKMQPVLAVYAGYSMAQEHVNPGPDLDPYVKDALDELEYVTGGPDSEWGAIRVKNGHPQPFKFTYVEIGNEDFFDKSCSYEGRYAQFYKAIKAKYPELELIATAPLRGMKPDVLDDHYYKRADEFFEDVKHYDTVDRSGPKIFVGEWATREGSPTTNMGAALGDAAWMTGMERNSDLIVMASYAPLFVNINPGGMQWESDLIGYNALTSYGSPGYYAQTMFAKYLGSEVPASSVSGNADRFFYSVTRDPEKGTIYLKLVNASFVPQPVEIEMTGVSSVANAGTLETLTGASLAQTNTISSPTRIVPVQTTI